MEELLVERGVEVDYVTVYQWVQRFTPLLADAAPTLPPPGQGSLAGRRDLCEGRSAVAHIYRAIDQFGQVIDVLVVARRDTQAARRFFEQAIGATKVTTVEVTTDQAPVYLGC